MKQIFIDFFYDDSLSNVIGEKTMCVTMDFLCYDFIAAGGRVLREIDERLSRTQEEADARMILNLSSITGPGNVAIRTSHTDALPISLGDIDKVKNGVDVS